MSEKEYFKGLAAIRVSRLNDITYAVNCKVPEKEIGLNSDIERMFYGRLVKEAEAHEKKYGFWPTFEMGEIESDDPRLDIYSEEA